MGETVLVTVIGFSVLLFAVIFAIWHYRREIMRKRVIGEMQCRRLYDLSRPEH